MACLQAISTTMGADPDESGNIQSAKSMPDVYLSDDSQVQKPGRSEKTMFSRGIFVETEKSTITLPLQYTVFMINAYTIA